MEIRASIRGSSWWNNGLTARSPFDGDQLKVVLPQNAGLHIGYLASGSGQAG